MALAKTLAYAPPPSPDMPMKLSTFLVLTAAALTITTAAHAQIGRPGAHIRYTAEVEPHLVLQHTDNDGIGVGVRGSFPIIDNGPVETINNSFALGIGLDWSHWENDCGPWDCDGNDFWVPLVVQWNFFFSDLISAFPEVGIGLEYESWDRGYYDDCRRFGGPGFNCDDDDDDGDLDVEFVLWLGVRFHLADEFALTVRLGTPSILIGASFFL
jgi:hypothetical protein